jgi:hypothetical protein
MASAELSRRVEKVVSCSPLVEMDDRQPGCHAAGRLAPLKRTRVELAEDLPDPVGSERALSRLPLLGLDGLYTSDPPYRETRGAVRRVRRLPGLASSILVAAPIDGSRVERPPRSGRGPEIRGADEDPEAANPGKPLFGLDDALEVAFLGIVRALSVGEADSCVLNAKAEVKRRGPALVHEMGFHEPAAQLPVVLPARVLVGDDVGCRRSCAVLMFVQVPAAPAANPASPVMTSSGTATSHS